MLVTYKFYTASHLKFSSIIELFFVIRFLWETHYLTNEFD